MAAILKSAILNLAMLDSAILVFPFKLSHTCQHWFPPFAQKNFTHSCWLNLMMAAILNSAMLDWDTAILDSDTLVSSLRFTQKHSHSTLTLTQTNSIGLKLIYSHLNWWWSHLEFHPLEFGHVGFSYLSISSQTHSHLPRLGPTICTKKLHSFSLTQLDDGSQLKFCHVGFIYFAKKKNQSFILIQLYDGSHLESCQFGFSHFAQKNFTHSFWLNFMMAAILNSTLLNLAMVDSAILHKTLTQINLIWLKLIHSHSNWWLQPSWILPCWIETLPSWIQTPCYLLSDSLKNTLTPLWLWIKLIQSVSNSFIFT